MAGRPQIALLPDGRRLHLQHGPIDLVVEARGIASEVCRAYGEAWSRFVDVLAPLAAELELLRTPLADTYPLARDAVARRMVAACWPHRKVFITPMAAVAGAVADEILDALLRGCTLRSAYVNNGGDVALWVADGEALHAGVVAHPARPALGAAVRLDAPCGIATSGWRGRSQSLGIADAVTVVAADAACADAAATLIANAVDAEHPGIERRPARSLRHDSDLGDRPVTVAVGPLPADCVDAALRRGAEVARAMQGCGLIRSALLSLQGCTQAVLPLAGAPAGATPPRETPAAVRQRYLAI